jgi:hypothetical protein
VCFSVVGGGTLEVLLEGGNARLPNFFNMSLYCLISVLWY